MSDLPEIPEEIKEVMREDELVNMRNLNGWAVGTVVQVDEDGDVVETHNKSWIELFNGEGKAGNFSGVRFMAVTNGEYEEAYAYATEESATGNEPAFYVKKYDAPSNPSYGKPAPDNTRI